MNSFKKELAFYEANKARLVSLFHGKWLIIKGKNLCGVFDNLYQAYEILNRLTIFKNETIMLKQCFYNEPIAEIPGGLTWQDDKGNTVVAIEEDIKAYEAGTRIKFPLDYKTQMNNKEN